MAINQPSASQNPRDYVQTLYEHCLTGGSVEPLSAFLHGQFPSDQPPLDLLDHIADDIHVRLIGLRTYYFDLRDRVIQSVHQNAAVDLSPIAPASDFQQYHLLKRQDILAFIHRQNGTAIDDAWLTQQIDGSLAACAQVYDDIQLTQQLQTLVDDWLWALQTDRSRHEQGGPRH